MNRKLWKAMAKIYYRRALALRSELERKTAQIEAMGEEIERLRKRAEQVSDDRNAAWERDVLVGTVNRLRRQIERLEDKR